jgi:hypothetical protein
MPPPAQEGPPLPIGLGHTPSWTSGDVLLWMKRAFSTNSKTRSAAEIRPLNWPNDFLAVTDPDWSHKRNVLLEWARCRAHGASFSELCRGRGWKSTRTYAVRDAAAAEIAAGINAAIARARTDDEAA